jgi:hypothetical protein
MRVYDLKSVMQAPKTRSVIFLLLCMLPLWLATGRSALADPPSSGLTVSPYIEQLTLGQNQNQASYPVTLFNRGSSPVIVRISAVNFTSLNENGGILFLDSKQSQHDPFALSGNLTFAYPEVIVGPHQSQTVTVTVANANQLADGGHFASILFTAQGTNIASGNGVVINQASSSLLFLSSSGGGTQNITLTNVALNSWYSSLPTDVDAVFQNKGNTQSSPTGLVQILDSSNSVVAQGQINTGSSLILPESKRLFILSLKQTGGHLRPGFYRLKISYQHVGQQTVTVFEQRFFYFNQSLIIALVFVIAGLVLLIRYRTKLKVRFRRRRLKSHKKPLSGRKIVVTFEDD